MEVGKRIRELRRQRGISLRDLARRSGVSKAYLSQLENDPDRKPSVDVVLRVAAALGVGLADLVGPAAVGPAAPPAPAAAGASAPSGPAPTVPAAPAAEGGANRPTPGSGGASPQPPPEDAIALAAASAEPPGSAGVVRGTSATYRQPQPARAATPRPQPAGSQPTPGPGALDPETLPWALRVFWQEHPEVSEADIRSLAAITWHGRRPFTPTDYWVLHQVLTGMTRGL